jgi:hypothetical protein
MRWNTETESPISKAFWWVAPIVVVAAAAAGYYFYKREKTAETPPVTEAPPPAPAQEPAEPEIRHPVPETAASSEPQKPLPPLGESDADLRETLTGLVGPKPVEQFLVPENIVRNFVVTVDNLPRSKTAVERRPIKATPGKTLTTSQGDLTTISEENFKRYAPFVKLVQSTDTKQLAAIYFRYYPLFQEAYEDLGYPGEYFNDRLVAVIDHLLQTPTIRGPIQVVQGKVFYEFADPQLESRSAGQKLLMRMGEANATVIKNKLRELRTEITTGRDPQPVPDTSPEAQPGSQ